MEFLGTKRWKPAGLTADSPAQISWLPPINQAHADGSIGQTLAMYPQRHHRRWFSHLSTSFPSPSTRRKKTLQLQIPIIFIVWKNHQFPSPVFNCHIYTHTHTHTHTQINIIYIIFKYKFQEENPTLFIYSNWCKYGPALFDTHIWNTTCKTNPSTLLPDPFNPPPLPLPISPLPAFMFIWNFPSQENDNKSKTKQNNNNKEQSKFHKIFCIYSHIYLCSRGRTWMVVEGGG